MITFDKAYCTPPLDTIDVDRFNENTFMYGGWLFVETETKSGVRHRVREMLVYVQL